MKFLSTLVLLLFMNFIAMPTIAIWCDIELNISTVTISEENKNPISNSEEDNQHLWQLPILNDFNFENEGSCSVANYANTSLHYLLCEYEVQSPPPDFLT